jgi:hypothetical protein
MFVGVGFHSSTQPTHLLASINIDFHYTRIYMKPSIHIELLTLISLLFTLAPVSAQSDPIPKVGAVESSETGAGCAYYLPANQRKKPIFIDVGKDPLMNFDGRDAILKKVSNQSAGKTNTTIYRTGDLRIQIDAKFADKYTDGPNTKVKIRITRNGRSKVIKAIGYCGC